MIASIADHGRGERADRRGPPVRERVIERGRAGALTSGVGRSAGGEARHGASAGGRAGDGPRGPSGERAREREGERVGPDPAQPRGGFFLFLFLFLFLLISFFF